MFWTIKRCTFLKENFDLSRTVNFYVLHTLTNFSRFFETFCDGSLKAVAARVSIRSIRQKVFFGTFVRNGICAKVWWLMKYNVVTNCSLKLQHYVCLECNCPVF
jgi:hypothetical protein